MTTFDFEDLLSQWRDEAEKKPRMVQAMVELTYGCNLRCVHCYNPTHQAKNELTTGQVFQILDQLAAQGCLLVGFTGGEIFSRRDTMEIFRYAQKLGFIINLLTNATLVNPPLADQIKELNPHQVEISVYGASAPVYEKVTQVPGSFSKFVQGVDLLRERQLPILLKLVVMTLNLDELDPMREFAVSRNLRYKIGTEIHPKVDGSQEPLAYRISPEEAFEVWRKISGEKILGSGKKLSEEDRCGSAGRLFDCLCGKSSAAITPYGKMNLCLSIGAPQYDLLTGGLAPGWEKLVELVRSAKPGPQYECETCVLAHHCTRGSMDGWLQEGAFDAPCLPYFREVAKRKAEFLS